MTESKTIDPKEIIKFSEHASDWWNTEGPLKTLHDINPARLKWIQGFISLEGLNVLDIGCGGGVLTEGLAKIGANMTGLDVEPGAIETAKAHALEAGLSIDYVCKPVDTYKPKQLFDAVTCLEMLEHVEDPTLIIKAAKHLIKPGGYFFLSTINRSLKAYLSVIAGAEYILSLLPRGTHQYERFIRPSELSATLRTHGFEVVDVTGLTYNPFSRSASLSQTDVGLNYLLLARLGQV